MHKQIVIEGYRVNCIYSKDGEIREAVVLVGEDKPGARCKDGPDAKKIRATAHDVVAKKLNLVAEKVRVQAIYSSLSEEGIYIVRRDTDGKEIGRHFS